MLLNTVLLLLSFVAYVTAQYETHSIGTCDLEPYILKLLTCDNHFFTAMRKDPDGDCGLRYKEAEFCYWKEIRECYVELYEGERLNSEVGSIMTQFPSEEAFCEGTGLGPIDFSEYHTNPCDSRYTQESQDCTRGLIMMYQDNPADTRLCRCVGVCVCVCVQARCVCVCVCMCVCETPGSLRRAKTVPGASS
ncbi:uncharacterized protein LOC144860095 [Branchiostoma floridae x Branchiostoma japonicum]